MLFLCYYIVINCYCNVNNISLTNHLFSDIIFPGLCFIVKLFLSERFYNPRIYVRLQILFGQKSQMKYIEKR